MKCTKALFIIAFFLLNISSIYAQQGNCPALDMPKEEISVGEKASLLHMYEEEKLAGDVYEALNNKWNLRVFANILNAEDHHQSMVAALMDKYEIEYTANNEAGKFENEELQKLYNQLVAQGEKSIEEALKVGATIEDLDIYDLNKALQNEVDNEDISFVYSNLKRGSENHMRAFNRWLSRYGISYQAQYISQEELQKIITP